MLHIKRCVLFAGQTLRLGVLQNRRQVVLVHKTLHIGFGSLAVHQGKLEVLHLAEIGHFSWIDDVADLDSEHTTHVTVLAFGVVGAEGYLAVAHLHCELSHVLFHDGARLGGLGA